MNTVTTQELNGWRESSPMSAGLALLGFQDRASRLDETSVQEFTLHLKDIYDLFTAPDYDPFGVHALDKSGLNYLAEQLKPRRLNHDLRLVIRLPGAIDTDLLPRVQTAVARYTAARIHENRVELVSLRMQGFKALQTGLLFLGIMLFLSAAAGSAEFLAEGLRALFAEGFLIAGWVSIWHPAELLLYAWWPHWRAIRVYEKLHDMELVIEGE